MIQIHRPGMYVDYGKLSLEFYLKEYQNFSTEKLRNLVNNWDKKSKLGKIISDFFSFGEITSSINAAKIVLSGRKQ